MVTRVLVASWVRLPVRANISRFNGVVLLVVGNVSVDSEASVVTSLISKIYRSSESAFAPYVGFVVLMTSKLGTNEILMRYIAALAS